jgi:hypothetical protein
MISRSVGLLFDELIGTSALCGNYMMSKASKGKKSKSKKIAKDFDISLFTFEMALLRLPLPFLADDWSQICVCCFRVLYLVSSKYETSERMQPDPRDALLVSISLNIVVDLLEEVLSMSVVNSTLSSRIFELFVGDTAADLKTTPTYFIRSFSKLLHGLYGCISADIFEKLCNQFNSLATLLFQCGTRTIFESLVKRQIVDSSKSTCDTVNESIVKVLQDLVGDATIDIQEGSYENWNTLAYIINILTTFFSEM